MLASLAVGVSSLTLPDHQSQLLRRTDNATNEEPEVDCFSPFSRRPQLIESDCEAAVKKIKSLPGANDPRYFTQDHYYGPQGFYTLSRWTSKGCMVMVSSTKTKAATKLTLSDVADTAVKVMKHCLENSPQPVGGSLSIGPSSSAFYVAVTGVGTPVDSSTVTDEAFESTASLVAGNGQQDSASATTTETSTTELIAERSTAVAALTNSSITGNSTGTNVGTPRYMCAEKEAGAFAVHPQDCEKAIDRMLHFKPPFSEQTWGYKDVCSIHTPKDWRWDSCQIYVDVGDHSQVCLSLIRDSIIVELIWYADGYLCPGGCRVSGEVPSQQMCRGL